MGAVASYRQVTERGEAMKWIVIGIMAAIGVLDMLLILGSAKLERMRNKNE